MTVLLCVYRCVIRSLTGFIIVVCGFDLFGRALEVRVEGCMLLWVF